MIYFLFLRPATPYRIYLPHFSKGTWPMTQERIVIFDTTLRDGEQSPGNSMNFDEKLLVADALDAMGVDVIEAGFAMASNGDFEAVHQLAKQTKSAVVC